MPDPPQLVIGVLASGRGSNFYAEGRIRLDGRRVHIRETA
jgi:hypothetical protein